MKTVNPATGVLVGCALLLGTGGVGAQDWPQWRGPNRDAKVTGFTAPAAWPKELTKKWQVKVGDGVATPALVGDKLYVFSRQDGNEITRCLSAADGKEIWADKYEVASFGGPDSGFQGPRSSPAVADGKVVTLGVLGTLSCLDADKGTVAWRKNDFKGSLPRFHTSSSPIIVDGLCIAQLGGDKPGGIVAYDLAKGDEKWKWMEDGTAYASPELLTVGGMKAVVAETSGNIVGLAVADGKLLWKTAAPIQGRMAYNACTPVVDGQTVIISGGGRGTKAWKVEKKGDEIAASDQWSTKDVSVQFNTPVVKNGMVYGISDGDKLFCLNPESGKTAWSTALARAGRPGFGSVVDVGPVLLALNPSGQLIVFEPGDKEFKEVAKYKVATPPNDRTGAVYAYPVVAGNRVFVKDNDSVTLWTIE
jgi:outer membrane protein assembly factor BamB